MSRSLDAFTDEFWHIQSSTVKFSKGRPTSVQQALLEMADDKWNEMVATLFEDYDADDLTVDDVMTLIRETNTCEGLDSELSVWVDELGDYKIKVYYGD